MANERKISARKTLDQAKAVNKLIEEKAIVSELEQKIKELEEENTTLRTSNKNLEDRLNIIQTEESKLNLVLEERAKGKPIGLIKKELERKGIFLELEEIKSIIENISDLPVESQEFFNTCKEKIKEIRKTDDEYDRNTDIYKLIYYEDKLSEALERYDVTNTDNIKEVLNIIKEGVNLIKEKGKFNKDLQENNIKSENVVSIMMDDYEKEKDKIIKFNIDNIKAI